MNAGDHMNAAAFNAKGLAPPKARRMKEGMDKWVDEMNK